MLELKELSHSFIRLECVKRFTMHNMLKDSGVYFGQPPILDFLEKNGVCTQNELAKALEVSPASIAVSIKRMQKNGVVEKIADDNDLRCNRISLTEKGRELTREMHRKFDQIDKIMFADFDENELATLKGYLDRIYNNLSSTECAKCCTRSESDKNGGDI